MMDVPIQQNVPTVMPEPLYAVTVSVISEATQAPPPPPPPLATIVTQTTQVPNTEAVSFVVHRYSEIEQFVKQLKETDFSLVIDDSITLQVLSIVDKYLGSSLPNIFCKELQANNTALKKELSELNYKEVIEESVKAHVMKKVKNFLPQFLPKPVSDFATPIIEESVKDHAVNKDVIEESVKAHVVNEVKNFLQYHKIHEELLNALTWSIKLDKSKSTQSTEPDQIPKKRDHGDDDQDEDPSARSNKGKETKKRRTRKETESSNKSSTPKESTKCKPTSKPSKSGKSRSRNDTVEEIVFEIGSDDVDQTFKNKVDDSEQPSPNANTEQPSPDVVANPKRKKNDWYKKSPIPPLTFDELISTPIDLSAFAMNHLGLTTLTRKVLVGPVFNLLKEKQGRLTIPVEIFFNNDLEYLKGNKAERTYCSSITKMPAARYTMEGIEDLIPNLWCSCITTYDEDALLGIKHWRSQRQQFYRAMINKTSKHKVFSKLRILSVISVTVDNKWGYGYLKEIIVKRADQKHYTFKERDFPDLNLRYIEYMLLLIAQQKINNLDGDVIVDFLTAMKMFTRSIFVQNKVEDAQLGYDPRGVIYEDKQKQKRLMKLDELHKFSDETPQSVYKTLHSRLKNFSLVFNPKSDMPNKAWSMKDQERTKTILKKIDVVLLKRRIIRSLEVLVGRRKTKTDKRLLQRIV
ncbi:hypothetical protein Tco_1202683 [Tanacetum coccineum]